MVVDRTGTGNQLTSHIQTTHETAAITPLNWDGLQDVRIQPCTKRVRSLWLVSAGQVAKSGHCLKDRG
jgi:hypothetical protein